MAILANITIGTAQLQSIKPDILAYLFDGQSDFSGPIQYAKDLVYLKIKADIKIDSKYAGYTNAELDTLLTKVKDLPEETPLVKIISNYAVANVMRQNKEWDEADIYESQAEKIQLDYYIDEDSDSVVDDEELQRTANVVFGR